MLNKSPVFLTVFQFMFSEKSGKYLLKLVNVTLFAYLLILLFFFLEIELKF